MEANRSEWDTLFEPYPFFEAYKHYLEIDITAENEDDLRKWKGWVESRLRTLTLKVNGYKQIYFFLLHKIHLFSIFATVSPLFCFCYFGLFLIF